MGYSLRNNSAALILYVVKNKKGLLYEALFYIRITTFYLYFFAAILQQEQELDLQQR
jgi:hypothetical protein